MRQAGQVKLISQNFLIATNKFDSSINCGVAMTFSMMTFSLMTLCLIGLFATLNMYNNKVLLRVTQLIFALSVVKLVVIILSSIMLNAYAECYYADWHYGKEKFGEFEKRGKNNSILCP